MTWHLHPFPDAKAFGFAIVHDADSAYSRRLAPIIDTFDEYGLRATITIFPFWAEWGDPERSWQEWRQQDPFFSPVAVPLDDDAERDFYLDVASRGHEIALHTPSETSSLRSEVSRAFVRFEEVFGHPAKVYVEHSPDNNLDCQMREGSNPDSPYYNTDILNDSGAWIWVCDHETSHPEGANSLDVRSTDNGPFCPRAFEKYGIERAFLRSAVKSADGDGFLETYTPASFDRLEASSGLVLMYMHLDVGWLDPATRRIRTDIRDRLADLTRRNVWLAPAGEILDRMAGLLHVSIVVQRDRITLANDSGTEMKGLTLVAPEGLALLCGRRIHRPSANGRIVVGDLGAGARREFRIVGHDAMA